MDDPTRRPERTWPRDRAIRWGRVAGSLSWFVVATAAGLLQLGLALPVLVVGRGWPGTVLAIAWGAATVFAAWCWVMGRWWIVLAPPVTIAAILAVAEFARPT